LARELALNITPFEIRGVLLENRTPIEIFIERENTKENIGNIYKGRVLRILPGMQSAFIDIGLEKAAFLYVKDLAPFSITYDDPFDLIDNETDEMDMKELFPQPSHKIQDLLKEGQEILVQTEKCPRGTKGARVTTNIALPGRYLVLLPFSEHIGVSHKIQDEAERERLKLIVENLKVMPYGFIVRTAAEGKSENELKRDMNYLTKLWEHIKEKKSRLSAPATIYQELEIQFRLVRDLPAEEIGKIIVDNSEIYQKLLSYINDFWPEEPVSVELYQDEISLFEKFGIELEISKALERYIWLKSGGYIVIDETEALTIIDVNTGRFVGKDNLETTILQTNMEAAKEIPYQLRLRNIGGIIIVDFIDMKDQKNKEKVFKLFESECARDRVKNFINPMTDLGLVELTRKRVRNSLSKILGETCPCCEGKGFILSKKTVCNEIFRELLKSLARTSSNRALLKVGREIGDLLFGEEKKIIEAAMSITKKDVLIEVSKDLLWHQYQILYN
jgi:ribonuclease G